MEKEKEVEIEEKDLNDVNSGGYARRDFLRCWHCGNIFYYHDRPRKGIYYECPKCHKHTSKYNIA